MQNNSKMGKKGQLAVAGQIATCRSISVKHKSKTSSLGGGHYQHSAYWYASHYGWTHSEASSYSGAYLDLHTYNLRGSSRGGGGRSKDGSAGSRFGECFDSSFNPLLFGVCIAMDIGVAVKRDVQKILDPVERDRVRRELMRDLRILRRPLYYARETKRRRQLAENRRKLTKRRTTAPMPTPEAIRDAWARRKESREAMIRLGGMLHDLACYVDSRLRIDEEGRVVGRNGGIRGWIHACVPELEGKYKTLMRYKAMAMRLRQAAGIGDPIPTATLLDEKPAREAVAEILSVPEPVFSHVFAELEWRLSPKTVLMEKPKMRISCGTSCRQAVMSCKSSKQSCAGRKKGVVKESNTIDRKTVRAGCSTPPTVRAGLAGNKSVC